MALEEDVIELQTRLAFQEDTLQALNTVIARQDRAIEQLRAQVEELTQKYRHGHDNPGQGEAVANERPPHY
ncbi:MAG TPA: SlyX family protein [Cellvibrionaceae bacterium]